MIAMNFCEFCTHLRMSEGEGVGECQGLWGEGHDGYELVGGRRRGRERGRLINKYLEGHGIRGSKFK